MKRNTLTSAVVAGITGMVGMVGVSVATESQPVHVNPDGLGQALIYPYYTARGGNDTLVSIVNTTARGKAVKVRFLEALNSREVLDFNLYLSPYDVWTGVVTETADGGGQIITADTSCTVPYFYGTKGGVQEFLAFEFTGATTNADGGPTGIERTASGYIEMIEMGTFVALGSLEKSITHASDRKPLDEDCSTVTGAWLTGGAWDLDSSTQLTTPTGGLYGAGAVINAAAGTMFSYNATAIDNFLVASPNHTNPARLEPGLADGDNPYSATFVDGKVEAVHWGTGRAANLLAVNATITQAEVWNEYTIESAVAANTEWVVTLPTRAYHIDNGAGGKAIGTAPIAPFTKAWKTTFGCEVWPYIYWDREEQTPTEKEEVIVSPPPPDTFKPLTFCQEANIVRFAPDSEEAEPAASEIFAEPKRADKLYGYTTIGLASGYEAGHMKFDWSGFESLPAAGSNSVGTKVKGLPVVGFSANTFKFAGVSEGVLANYGGSFNHRGTRDFVASAQ